MAEVSDNVFGAEELAFSIQDLKFMLSGTVVPLGRGQGGPTGTLSLLYKNRLMCSKARSMCPPSCLS